MHSKTFTTNKTSLIGEILKMSDTKPTKRKTAVQQRYEHNPDVQRWLRDQTLDTIGAKPEFDPTVLRGGKRERGSLKQTERGRAAQVSSWIAYEFETQGLLYQAGADVPRPLAQIGNAVLMEDVGDDEEVAPRLSDVDLAPE